MKSGFYPRSVSLASILLILGGAIAEEHSLISSHHKVRHERHKRQHYGYFFHQNFTVGPHDPSVDSGEWGPFSEASECSRSCGGGVAFQNRICMDVRSDGTHSCVGPPKRYFSCNIQDCPEGTKDFRELQCSRFNTLPFEGKYYSWFPYTKAANPCELNCRPKGERFYYRHDKKVIDGTRCREGSLDICVEGVCMPVGCDLILGSEAKEDKCRECGGNGGTCDTLEGVFDHDSMKVGYNDIMLIPSGATNVRIEEKLPTNNYLAVRNLENQYYLNGDWKIDYPQDKRFAGVMFHYERKASAALEPEKLWTLGPTTEPLYIVLLYQEKNQGILYEYSIPKSVNGRQTPDRYTWTVGEFNECPVTCGGGIQRRQIVCARASDYETVDPNLCDPNNRPETERVCGDIPCNAVWDVGEWRDCRGSGGCGTNVKGIQYRMVSCVERKEGNVTVMVAPQVCETAGPTPKFYQECEIEQKGCPEWVRGPWSACNKPCGEGAQTRKVSCKVKSEAEPGNDEQKREEPEREVNLAEDNGSGSGEKDEGEVVEDSECERVLGPKPPETQNCTSGPCEGVEWITTPWSGCSGTCGLFLESREIFCATEEGKLFPGNLCDPNKTPSLTQECSKEERTECNAMWHSSEWSQCSAKCGLGVQTRVVFCGEWKGDTLNKVPELSCDPSKKMALHQNCTGAPCEGQWFTGPYGRCTAACGGGYKTRPILCIQDEDVIESKNCDPGSKPENKEACNTEPCDEDNLLTVGGCKESKHGCCPDGVKAAGDNFAGCAPPKIPEGQTCHDTEFGCCADGVTPAMGSFKKGCPPIRSCNDTEFGCCPDGVTPARTSEGEDCPEVVNCEDSLYGCCPDGVMPAIGANFTGCENIPVSGCELSTFGCCPDNVTSAEGKYFAGCDDELGSGEDCALTTHGCCSDQVTTASGPDNLGCPSNETALTGCANSTFGCCPDESTEAEDEDGSNCEEGSGLGLNCTESFFGCCPDNVTNAKGPDYEGCENCTFTEFGCCLDTITPASGPDFEGCEAEDNCTLSEYGCCPDNVTIALGSDMEGCESNCTVSEFGCCPDNVTVALGSDLEGCNVLNCTDSEYGCCPDNVTLATGPDMEGCEIVNCTDSEFGCCPDNVTLATGPDMEGCEGVNCTDSEFGCCPDHVTLATGPNMKGCNETVSDNCTTSEFGCCEDGFTSATGLEMEGCEPLVSTTPAPCNNMLYGCCPDRVTPARGSNFLLCCYYSRFGCCPDNITEATGPNYAGCGCHTSKWGCCPNGIQLAKGPRYYGCTCETYPFGCCQDNYYPAQGPNFEGCNCLIMLYGCCSDGRSPASGPDQEGCGCSTSQYGCCGDNVTPAKGPRYEGCPCSVMPFGCCPDGITVSRGPNYEGCPCSSMQYGCCQDNITPARGENGEGCECDYAVHGCCPDRKTAAIGPNYKGCACDTLPYGCCPDGLTASRGPGYRGCPCDSSPFGCCPDGITLARGPSNEGCGKPYPRPGPDVVVPREVCSLEKDPGPCRNYTVKWFFDMTYGGCSRFWYGGCDGNGNKFDNQEDCEGVCVTPEGPDACTLPRVAGPCKENQTLWYFDASRSACESFVYGGCLGNNNRFSTKDICEETCIRKENLDTCEQPLVTGPCNGAYPRYYYDQIEAGCVRFTYGGCKGNDNNFENEQECRQTCATVGDRSVCVLPRQEGNCRERQPRVYYDYVEKGCRDFVYTGCEGNRNRFVSKEQCQKVCNDFPDVPPTAPEESREVCKLTKEAGPCTKLSIKWYYNEENQRCEQFYYGGCDGNENRFDNRDDCERRCVVSVEPPLERNVCLLPNEVGNCYEFRERWYYDAGSGTCRRFHYSGCGGNENNFQSYLDCESRCGRPASTELPEGMFKTEYCFLQKETGPCRASELRWYYDGTDGVCKEFYYGGCDGNGNRFRTRGECEGKCSNSQDVCQLPEVRGACSGNFTQWRYIPQRDECVPFIFGGCQGNANRFNDKESCEVRCKKEKVPVTTLPPEEVCLMPADPGSCAGSIPKYYYDAVARRCEEFRYGGCDGNDNRFDTPEICERTCQNIVAPEPLRPTQPEKPPEPARPPKEIIVPDDTEGTSNEEVCRRPMDQGKCTEEHPRWFYNPETGTCLPFIYTGCGGNKNRFKTSDICIRFCTGISPAAENEVIPPQVRPPASGGCPPNNCGELWCPYGIDENRDDASGCVLSCSCYNPCKNYSCPPGQRCALEVTRNAEGEPVPVPECRLINKPGRCPAGQNGEYVADQPSARDGSRTECQDYCREDADCRGNQKCCLRGCAHICVQPVEIEIVLRPEPETTTTTTTEIVTTTTTTSTTEAPRVPVEEEPEEEKEMPTVSGSDVTIRCRVRGAINIPQWSKGESRIKGGSNPRIVIQDDGSLYISQVRGDDSGVYTCVVRVRVMGPPVSRSYRLVVHVPAQILPTNRVVLATLGQNSLLVCKAIGSPQPSVNWWFGGKMLPFSSKKFQQFSDHSLLIRTVTIYDIGSYQCQAYNGLGERASYSVTLVQKKDATRVMASSSSTFPGRGNVVRTRIYSRTSRDLFKASEDKTRTYDVKKDGEGGESVSVDVEVATPNFRAGSPIQLDCHTKGFPPSIRVDLKWYHGNELEKLEDGDRYSILDNGTLIINNGTASDSGLYRCQANSVLGQASSTISIAIEEIFIPADCTDNPLFAKCELIVKARYCNSPYYGRYCCRTCSLAGQPVGRPRTPYNNS